MRFDRGCRTVLETDAAMQLALRVKALSVTVDKDFQFKVDMLAKRIKEQI